MANDTTAIAWIDDAIAFEADECPACGRPLLRVSADDLDQASCVTCGWYAERGPRALIGASDR